MPLKVGHYRPASETPFEWHFPSKHAYMGPIWATHMGSVNGFSMGPIWVSPYAGCPDGSHMVPI